MPRREDLAYEKRKTETPYIFTGASDIDEALEIARHAIWDAQTFRDYARVTGVDVIKKDISWGMAAGFFACGAAVCFSVLYFAGVI